MCFQESISSLSIAPTISFTSYKRRKRSAHVIREWCRQPRTQRSGSKSSSSSVASTFSMPSSTLQRVNNQWQFIGTLGIGKQRDLFLVGRVSTKQTYLRHLQTHRRFRGPYPAPGRNVAPLDRCRPELFGKQPLSEAPQQFQQSQSI